MKEKRVYRKSLTQKTGLPAAEKKVAKEIVKKGRRKLPEKRLPIGKRERNFV